MKNKILVILALLCFYISPSQSRTCGTEEHMEEKMKDPVFAQEWKSNQAKFNKVFETSRNKRQSSMNTIIVPVAVHFTQANESDRACLEALAQNQIDILNADFTATNEDAGLWDAASVFYPNTEHGSADVVFCIATENHPVGIDNELIEGNPAVTIGYNFGNGNNVDGNWSGYLNFVIRNIGALGFSPLGGSIAQGSAVTMDDQAFGSGSGCPGSGVVPGAPYNLGRTTTHELGHFFNLYHIWGDGGCGVDDGISDTPLASGSNGGCPGPGDIPGCVSGEYELSMNYMDYTNDACMYMFSQGQMDVAEAYLTAVQNDFKPNTTSNCAGSTEPNFNLTALNSPVFSCPETGEDAVFEIDFSTINDYNVTTFISAEGAPENSTISITPTFINSNGTITMTIGNLVNTTLGDYTITLTASSFVSTKTIDVVLKNNCTSIECNEIYSGDNVGLEIPDGIGNNEYGDAVTSAITFPDLGVISTLTANVDVSHTYIQDLVVVLYHPDDTTYAILWGRDCGSEDGFDVTFSDDASAIQCANPTVGTYAPYEPLSIFEGMTSEGEWTLLIQDGYNEDVGILNDWSIEICSEVALGTDENNFNSKNVLVYPNPNNGAFNVEFNSFNDSDVNISVFDILGREILKNNFSHNTIHFNQSIDLKNVKPGTYLMTISTNNAKVVKKIIVE